MIARKALVFLVPVALGALVASQWNDISRYMKIKQMSYGNGHPENVPAGGRASYPHPGEQTDAGRQGKTQRPVGGTSPRDRTGVDPKGPIDESSPDLQTRG
ncbi:MAG: DUF6893 family small protein [Streptosporangiaceae bacterium]